MIRTPGAASWKTRWREPARPRVRRRPRRASQLRPRGRGVLRQPADAVDADPQTRSRTRRRAVRARHARDDPDRGRAARWSPTPAALLLEADAIREVARSQPGPGIGDDPARHLPDARAVPAAARHPHGALAVPEARTVDRRGEDRGAAPPAAGRPARRGRRGARRSTTTACRASCCSRRTSCSPRRSIIRSPDAASRCR